VDGSEGLWTKTRQADAAAGVEDDDEDLASDFAAGFASDFDSDFDPDSDFDSPPDDDSPDLPEARLSVR
jgi:hypothetical protein